MLIELVNRGVKIKPPAFSSVAKTSNDPFWHSQLPSDRQVERLCKLSGMPHNRKSPYVWLYVRSGVRPHKDRGGKCLVYLARGVGTLYVLYRGKIEEYRAIAGDVLLFNDRLTHWWMSDTPCTLMVINVKEEGLVMDKARAA